MAPATVVPTISPSDILSETNLLLLEVSLDRLPITDSLAAYNGPDGLLIPVGELGRLLDADLTVSPGQRRITGSIGEARRPLVVDMATSLVRIDGKSEPLVPGDMIAGTDELYVRPALLEKLLPVRVKFDESALHITLEVLEPLPIQSRLDRLGRLRALQPDMPGSNPETYRVETPSSLFSLPALDVSLQTGVQQRTPHTPYNYDLRAGGDLLYSNFQGFLGSDDKGKPVSARVLIERRDPDGQALGGFGITRASAGDIFTPALAIGPRSLGGRGFSMSTAPLAQQAVFGRIDLRGELPIGYDVELYVNDVLRSGQATPVQGRYEFRDVPLVRGVNVIRIVSYGPRGERSEDVRVVSVGGGQVPKGAFVVDFGAAQQERPLIDLRTPQSDVVTSPGIGDLRIAMNMLYGISEMLTVEGGAAIYSPNGQGTRQLGTLGGRTSIGGLALQAHVAADNQGGTAAAVAIAAKLFGISAIARHGEYRHGFVDETIPRGGDGRALTRSSEIDLDGSVKAWGNSRLPLSVRVSRDQYVNGDVEIGGIARASAAVGGVFVSAGLDYSRVQPRGAAQTEQLSGVLSASSFAAFKWQLRGNIDYSLLPSTRLRAVTIVADRSLSPTRSLRLGVGRSFSGDSETTVQAGLTSRLGFADLAITGEYSTPRNDWRIGLQMAFSLARDPLGNRYVMTRPGAAAGGNMALQAFVDRNGDGVFQPGEAPVGGLTIDGGINRVATDDKGRALVTGLSYGSMAQLHVQIDDIDLDDVVTPPSTIEFMPRAGTTAVAYYPIQIKGSIMARLTVRREQRMVGLSAVRVRAVRAGGAITEGKTEYDGTVLFDSLRPGAYSLELDPDQANRLKMRLEEPITFKIGIDGGVLPDVEGVVVFDGAPS